MNPTTEQEKQDHIYTTTFTNLRSQLKTLEDQNNHHHHLLLQAIQFLNTIRNTVPTDIRPAIIDLIKTYDHLPPPFHPPPAYENPRPEGHNSQG